MYIGWTEQLLNTKTTIGDNKDGLHDKLVFIQNSFSIWLPQIGDFQIEGESWKI